MILSFTLTMPNRGSWNGKWSGEDNLYAKCITVSAKQGKIILNSEISRNFFYSWNDGWSVNIEVEKITSSKKKKIENNSKGFCGYDWMIDSIISYDSIMDSNTIKYNKELIQEMFD